MGAVRKWPLSPGLSPGWRARLADVWGPCTKTIHLQYSSPARALRCSHWKRHTGTESKEEEHIQGPLLVLSPGHMLPEVLTVLQLLSSLSFLHLWAQPCRRYTQMWWDFSLVYLLPRLFPVPCNHKKKCCSKHLCESSQCLGLFSWNRFEGVEWFS